MFGGLFAENTNIRTSTKAEPARSEPTYADPKYADDDALDLAKSITTVRINIV